MSELPLISLRNVSKTYGKKVALKNLTMDIYPGQVIGYIGPNGAGKSTTVKILVGLIADYAGSVVIDGLERPAHDQEMKRRIGYVPENAELYDLLTPVEYLEFIGQLYSQDEEVMRVRALQLLEAFGLKEVNARMNTFSKGMKQKVLIIAALIHDPLIVVLDEPLSGLDANAVIFVKELIIKLARSGKTIFYCSHIMDVVEKVSDRILLLQEGEIIADGTFASLKENFGDTLETVFTKLTSADAPGDRMNSVMNAFK